MLTAPLPTLLADIGGTNVRFALLEGDGLGPVERRKVADYPSLEDAAVAFLGARRAERAVLAAAGPVEGGRCLLTNHDWAVDEKAFAAALGLEGTLVVNDFEAQARSLPALREDHLHRIGHGTGDRGAPMVVLGPGTGLGVGALLRVGAGFVAVASEGGHATLAAGDEREEAVLRYLRRRFGHVSAERVLCGAGLENLYDALSVLEGHGPALRADAEITAAGPEDPVAQAAVGMFCDWLGSVAGDLALTFGAKGGVFIAGGIVPRILPALDGSGFRRRFEAKGRFRSYLAPIPTAVVLHPDAAMLGLGEIARQGHARTA